MRRGESGRDDADVLAAVRVDHDQDARQRAHANADEPFFRGVHFIVGNGDRIWVVEDGRASSNLTP
jgi:hypothetical protein